MKTHSHFNHTHPHHEPAQRAAAAQGLMHSTQATEGEQDDLQARQQATRRSTWVSVVVNLGLTVSQIVAGVVAHSQGLIADGIHSLSDLVADFVVLFAAKHSSKEADTEHPYGHYRFETAASLFLGVLLLVVGIGMIFSAITKLQHFGSIAPVNILALWVALLALLVKEILFRYMLGVAKRVRSSMLIANAWHARSDAAASLIVCVGIVGSLMGYPILDLIAAIIVGLIISKMGWSFAWRALNDLMDRSATEDETEQIRQTVLATAGVEGAHDIRTRKMGDMLMVDVHLEVAGNKTVREGHEIAMQVRTAVLAQHHVLDVMTHVDPV